MNLRLLATAAAGLLLGVSCDPDHNAEPAANAPGPRHELLQFDAVPDDETKAALADAGIRISGHEVGLTYVVSIPGEGASSALPGTRLLGAIPADAKAPAALRRGSLSPWAVDSGGRALVSVRFHADVSRDEALDAAARAGAVVTADSAFDDFRTMDLALDSARISSLVAQDAVLRVEEGPPEATPANINSAAQAGILPLLSGPYGSGDGLRGAGYTAGIWEAFDIDGLGRRGAKVAVHVLYTTRIGYGPDVESPETYLSAHATHVAGTIGADETDPWGAHSFPAAAGMARGVRLESYDVGSWESESLAAARAGMIAGNNSWLHSIGWTYDPVLRQWVDLDNETWFGLYAGPATNADYGVWTSDKEGKLFLQCFCAGNHRGEGRDAADHDGTLWYDPTIADPYYDTMSEPASAKNVVAVGAVDADGRIADFSSIGPVDDGRIKPDLVAKGVGTLSTDLGMGVRGMSGTSTAAPVVTGASVLLVEQFEATSGRRPSTAELKALLLHAATDLGRPGPDYVYGWGLVNAQAAADLILADGGSGDRIVRDSVGHADHDAFHFQVDTGPIRMTITWIDPPGRAARPEPDLVNNLDIRLLSPSGVVHYPFRLDPANPTAIATTAGPNLVDNVEQIFVANPEAGRWRLDVAGTFVPVGPLQTYGLVASHPIETGWVIEELQNVTLGVDPAGNALLSWPSTADPSIVELRVYRTLDFGRTWELIATLPRATTSYTDADAPDAPMIMYDVRAILDLGGQQAFDALPGAQRTPAPGILRPEEGGDVPFDGSPAPVTGTAEPLATVTLFDNGAQIGSVTADTIGLFTFAGHVFAEGDHALTAVAATAGDHPSLPSLERRFRAGSDVISPATISTLAADEGDIMGASALLTWTAPGDNGMAGTAMTYEVRYSTTAPLDETTWNTGTLVPWGIDPPRSPGSRESMKIGNLSPGQSYWFALRATDEAGNRGGISNSAFIAPEPGVVDLRFSPSSGWEPPAAAGLEWTSVGSFTYVLRVSTAGPIDEATWASATDVPGEPAEPQLGTTFSMVVGGMALDTTYWFAIRAGDLAGRMTRIAGNAVYPEPDSVPPGTVADLRCSIQPVPYAFRLYPFDWTATGDDGAGGAAQNYELRASIQGPVDESTWETSTYAMQWVPGGLATGFPMASAVALTLRPGDEVWVAIRAVDNRGNWGGVSPNVVLSAPPDTVPPPPIANLATMMDSGNSVWLLWNSPADDGGMTAGAHAVWRSSVGPMTDGDYQSIGTLMSDTIPWNSPGAQEGYFVQGLPPGQTSWFVVLTRDEYGNWSGVSNNVSWTPSAP